MYGNGSSRKGQFVYEKVSGGSFVSVLNCLPAKVIHRTTVDTTVQFSQAQIAGSRADRPQIATKPI